MRTTGKRPLRADDFRRIALRVERADRALQSLAAFADGTPQAAFLVGRQFGRGRLDIVGLTQAPPRGRGRIVMRSDLSFCYSPYDFPGDAGKWRTLTEIGEDELEQIYAETRDERVLADWEVLRGLKETARNLRRDLWEFSEEWPI